MMDELLQPLLERIDAAVATPGTPATTQAGAGDRRAGDAVYRLSKELGFAVKVALTTGRPLLLTGPPGSGKSSLSAYLAQLFGWRYYDHVITSRTEANELLWRFDSLRKLSDASDPHRTAPLIDGHYVEPGVLWWAFAPESANTRGGTARVATEPNRERNAEATDPDHAVVLLDEIDKADPDVPNALLVALGAYDFRVVETDHAVSLADADVRRRVLVVVTSNGERSLPPAFVRRCIAYQLTAPSTDQLVDIAKLHLPGGPAGWDDEFERRVRALATRTEKEAAATGSVRRSPGTAEFLDAVRAASELTVGETHELWAELVNLTIIKAEIRK